MIPAISLCSSVGYMDEAFFLEGFSIRAQVEIIPWRRQVLARRFPRAQRFEDIHDVGRHNLPANPAIIFGGFPCQPVSGAGKRKGTADERWIWPEFARIVGELRPRFVFLENADEIGAPIRVDGTIVAPAPGLEVIASLTALGYDARWGIVPGSAAGAPHQRLRWWCVAWRIPDTDQDQCSARIGINEQRGQTAVDHAGWDAADAREQRQPTREATASRIHNPERNNKTSYQIGTAAHDAPVAGDPGVALGDTHEARLEVRQALTGDRESEFPSSERTAMARYELRHAQRPRLEGQACQELAVAAQSQQGPGRQSLDEAHEPDLGGIVFNGIACRLDRLAGEQLWAAPLGLQPYPFEPPRLTDDDYDWKDRVEAVGDGVVIPVVRAFAAGIREVIFAQDALRRERAGQTRKD